MAKKTCPDGHTFTLGWMETRYTFVLETGQLSHIRLKLSAPPTVSRVTCAKRRITRVLSQKRHHRLRLESQRVQFQVEVDRWNETSLHRAVLGRLRRKPWTAEDLARTLSASPDLIGTVLNQMRVLRRAASLRPGVYFALPWERTKSTEVLIPGISEDYQSLAAAFWVFHHMIPTPTQEPDEATRAEVRQQLIRQQQEENQRAEQRERLRMRFLQEKWLIPSGNLGLQIGGVSCRIDTQFLQDGRLWTFERQDGQVISAKISGGVLWTLEHGTWAPAQSTATAHFGEAREAYLRRRLQPYDLGREVLHVVLNAPT